MPPLPPADLTSASSPPLRTVLLGLVAALALSGLIYLLSPVLTPFLIGTILAYVANPLVDQLCRWSVPRALAAAIVLTVAWLLIIALVLMMVPLIRDEAARVSERLPEAISHINLLIAPWAERLIGTPVTLDGELLQALVTDHRDIVHSLVQRVFNSVRIGGLALVGLVINGLLAPVVTFYLLLDWHTLIRKIDTLIPRQRQARITALATDIDQVLSSYLRGQLLVMAILAAYYAIALSIAGLPSALVIGLLTGALIFIPYVGFASAFLLAVIVALLQFTGWSPVLWVVGIYCIGQFLESFILTPYLVGEKVGLPPLAVIFALMAFGQIFGFFGVLLALPASAAIVIGLREAHRSYLGSQLYRGN